MGMPRSDAVVSHVARLVCPNVSPLVPDDLAKRLPFITWTLVRPEWSRSAQSRLAVEFDVNVSAHHNNRTDAYALASRFCDAVEGAGGLVVPDVGRIVYARSRGEPFEVRAAAQSPTYFQFVGSHSFVVRPVSL